MKSFLQENPIIVFCLGLPLLLVSVFLLFTGIPSLVVAAPQYDLLYATQYYNHPNGMKISVINKKVIVTYQNDGKNHNRQQPQLWRYTPKTGAVQEIVIMLPSSIDNTEKKSSSTTKVVNKVSIDVPDLKNLTIDSSSIAPDGYEFSAGGGHYRHNIFGGLFHSSHYNNKTLLKKNGRSIYLPNIAGRYSSNNLHFVGWVIL
ncbi:MAG: hypothetical protein JKX78_04555 [Alteromonadaceae bacterium]|nr:hypothetical protein [Alteromonadaceae bacterium]